MKNALFVIVFMIFGISHAQLINVGLKGGINFNSNGDLNLETFQQDLKFNSENQTGYHFGVITEIKLPLFLYVRPEFLFTHTKSSYSGDYENTDLSINKFDIPLLVGLRFLRIGRVFAGPVFSFIQKADLDETRNLQDIRQLNLDDFSTGMQVGAGLELGKFGADIRWEKGFSDTTANFLAKVTDGDISVDPDAKVRIDTRQQQFIVSVYYKFF